MSEPTPVSATLDPGPAAVFLDVENLFKPFVKKAPANQKQKAPSAGARRAAGSMAPGSDYNEIMYLGSQVAMRLVEWFGHKGFTIAMNHGRSYGQFYDDGVRAVWDAFVDKKDWNHTLTRKDNDRADNALIDDLALFVGSDSTIDWIFVGSSDFKLVLRRSGSLLIGRPDVHLAAILMARTAVTDRAFNNRNDVDFQRFNTKLYLWKLYHEVLTIEKNAARRDAERREQERRDQERKRAARALANQQRDTYEQWLHDERTSEVSHWARLSNTDLIDAVRAAVGFVTSENSLRHLCKRYCDAAMSLGQQQCRRVLAAIGSVQTERLAVIESDPALS